MENSEIETYWRVLMRDGYLCRNCGSKAVLTITPFDETWKRIDERPCSAVIDHCFTLCSECQKKIIDARDIKTFGWSYKKLRQRSLLTNKSWWKKTYGGS